MLNSKTFHHAARRLSIACAVVLVGCASRAPAPAPAEARAAQEAEATVVRALDGMKAADVEQIRPLYGPHYRSYTGRTFDQFAKWIYALEERGWLDGLEFDIKNVDVELDLDEIYVEAELFQHRMGTVSMTFKLQLDDARWMIVHSTEF